MTTGMHLVSSIPVGNSGALDKFTETECYSLPNGPLSDLLRSTRATCMRARQVLFREGDHAESIFMLREGAVRLFRFLPNGGRIVVAFGFPGEIIGLSFGASYPFSAEVIDAAVVCKITRTRLSHLSAHSTRLQGDIITQLQDLVSASNEDILPLLHQNAEERVARFIRMLARCSHTKLARGAQIEFVMTRADISDYLGLTTETVCRAFCKLKNDGVISALRPDIIRIENANALVALANSEI